MKAMFRLLIAVVVGLVCVSAVAQEKEVPHSQQQIQLSFAPVVKRVSPAVVNIYTKTRVQVQEASPLMNDPFFRQFFGQQGLALPGRTREQVISSLGSGVIVRADGLVVTSHHVVKDAQEIRVVLADKREFEASVTMRDPRSDLAFLRLKEAASLPFVELRNSDALEVGDMVLAIGNPFGVGQTVTSGIISALARGAVGVSDYQFFIQTDAAINPGNSGGALVDMDGKLIGINTAIYSKSGGSMGIGFAIPSNMVSSLLASNIEGGKVVRPWVGISAQPMTSEMAESLGLKAPRGVILQRVIEGSPAHKAGLKTGDVIVAVDGVDISSDQEMMYRIALVPLGKESQLTRLNAGREDKVVVKMMAPPENISRDMRRLTGAHPLSGISIANLSPALAAELGFDDIDATGVVVVQVEPSRTGVGGLLQVGDILVQINKQKVESTKQVDLLLKTKQRAWQVVYLRGGQLQTLTIRM